MKIKNNIKFALVVLVLATLACGLFSAVKEEDRGVSEASPQVGQVTSDQESEYEPGYEPGWHIFSNANFVNGLAFYEGTLWAATEGGVVAWDIETDQAVKYTPLDGMGHLSAYDVVICPMPNPTVVVATETGLSLYDIAAGTWSAAPITPEDSYVSNSKSFELFCDQENGRLLIAYFGLGVLDITSGGWQSYQEKDGLGSYTVDDVTVAGSDIWVTGYKNISVIREQGVQVYSEETGTPVDLASNAPLKTTSDGTVWVGANDGLLRFQQGNMDAYTTDNTESFPAGKVHALSVAPDETIWLIASGSNHICRFDPAQNICIYTYEGDPDHYTIDMVAGNADDVYYSTDGGGIWAYNGSEWRNLLLKDERLAGNFVEAFAEDSNGMMWVATDNGIQHFDPNNLDTPWETFTAGESGPPSSWGEGVFISPSGDVWFAHDSKRASSFDGSAWSRYGEEDGIIGYVNAIAFDKDGIPYLGTSEGLLIMGGASHTLLTDADGLPSKNVRSLYADGDIMWVGTVDGLVRLQNGSIETVLDSSFDGLNDDNISVIQKTADGSLILGTPRGLVSFDGEQVTIMLEPYSIAGMFGEEIQAVSDITISLDGSIWVGTYAGVYHGDGQNWEHFTTADGLPANNVNTVFVDSSGVVWVGAGFSGSGGGIARFIPGETSGNAPNSDETNGEESESSPAETGTVNSDGPVKYDENTGMPLDPDAEQVYSTDSVLNYWSNTDPATLREFYLTEMPKIGWLLDVDENGNCLDDDRCMGWHGDYNDPETQTFFFLKGEEGYITLNLIPENSKMNVVFMVNEPAD